VLTILILSVCFAIVTSAACSLFEAILYSVPPSHLELMARKGHPFARLFKQLRQDIDRPITAILTLNTVANTIGAAVAGAAAVAVLGEQYLLWFSLAFTTAILIFSEVLPKTVGVAYNRRLAPMIARPLYWLTVALAPVIATSRAITRLIPRRNDSSLVSAEELQAVAALSRQAGEIEAEQERVITNILQLGDKTVRQAMTPRTVTFAQPDSLSVDEARTRHDQWRMHSRVPVYGEDIDDVSGIVLSNDLFKAAADGQGDLPLSRIMGPVHFVPETAPLNRILIEFFERRQHLFVVVDEYGSVTGVISLEDIIEEIMGREILDESDRAKSMRELATAKGRLMHKPATKPQSGRADGNTGNTDGSTDGARTKHGRGQA